MRLWEELIGTTSLSRPSLDLNLRTMGNTLDPRIAFSRGTNATIYNSAGRVAYAPANVFTNSTTDLGSGGGLNNITRTANAAAAPSFDGSTTATLLTENSSTGAHNYYVGTGVVGPSYFTQSVYVKDNGRRYVWFTYANGADYIGAMYDLQGVTVTGSSASGHSSTVGTTSITSVGNSWYRITLSGFWGWSGTSGYYVIELSNTGTQPGAADVSYTGGGTVGVYVWGAQFQNILPGQLTDIPPFYKTSGTPYYGPRFDYNPSTLQLNGLLIEQASTNIALWSQDQSNAVWLDFSAGTSHTGNNVVSPDGTSDGATVNLGAAANAQFYQTVSVTNGTTYTASAWVKVASGTQAFRFDIYDGTTDFVSSDLTATTTWTRFSWTATVTHTSASGNFGPINQAAGGAKTIQVFGLQLEALAFPTSYIPTTAATVTRNADVATINLSQFASLPNTGTLYIDTTPNYPVANTPLRFNPFGAYTFNVFPQFETAGSTINARASGGSVGPTTPAISGGVVQGTRYKIAMAYQNNDQAIAVNGGNLGTAVLALPTAGGVPTSFTFGGNYSVVQQAFWLAQVKYWTTRASNNQLVQITK